MPAAVPTNTPSQTPAPLEQSINSKTLGTINSDNCNSRSGTPNNIGSMVAARQLVAASPGNVQTDVSPGNSIHLTSSQRYSVPTSAPGPSGHRHKPAISTYLDDFKQGFPSKGLSVVSSHWWGSGEPDIKSSKLSKNIGRLSVTDLETDDGDGTRNNVDSSRPNHRGKDTEAEEVVKSCIRVTKMRRSAAISARRALQLAVTKGYGVQKLGRKEAAILPFVYGDSIPRQWLAALPSSP